MKHIEGFYWPDDVGDKYHHSLRHVYSLEWAISACKNRRTAVQAGGNVGIWPKRLGECFERVYTFEPEPISRECLEQNVYKNVIVSGCALGAEMGRCHIRRKSLGSHTVTAGDSVPVITVDSLKLQDVDLLQLDVEGYEWHALKGATETILRCHPVIQVELRGFTEKFGKTDREVRDLLSDLGYRYATARPGNDHVFVPQRKAA